MNESTIRLNKYLANMGICSRRDVKDYLKTNNVTVNGERVKESGIRIDPDKDDIRLNGNKIKQPEYVYYLLNKPKDIVSTTADEYNRKNVTSFITTKERIYPVGRLDKDTTGLILLTNDGELTNLLTHPRYHVDKTYQLTIEGSVDDVQLRALRNGVLLDDGITAPAEVWIVKKERAITQLEMTIHEGRNRQIRRMCDTVGLRLTELKRIKFGPIEIDKLAEGKFRQLTDKEIKSLKNAALQ
ncbi:MAG TPA: pseudouridine synthase [Candidatus Acidoferrales bacterium]|nr:pseudouridine synthase [Candidatus Acidoferrales bacterium]